jgi:uncharacterized protein (DUF1330 family)
MSVMLIAFTTINPAEPEALQAYVEGTTPLIAAAGGKLISRFSYQESAIESTSESATPCPQFVSILEYPTAAAIKELFASEAYAKLKPCQEKAFTTYNICIYDSV